MSRYIVTLDERNDVLYLRREDARIRFSHSAAHDPELIINFDEEKRVVGVQLIGLKMLPIDAWMTHPDRDALPEDMLVEIDRTVSERSH